METDSLHTLVSSAIWRAEQLEDHAPGSAPRAWAEVSVLEEELAKALPLSLPEGRIARRGAVRAALKAGDYARAQTLAGRYLAEKEIPEPLRATLQEMLEADARSLARLYPHAAQRYLTSEARNIARRLQQEGPFSLAA